ncbi:precorrin-6A reductase [Agathobaculum sp.]|uniref:precorrin-6A reductase n=1 Tax=Agathobaculum sp. TaxID=2048138 RepID=UPI002A821FB9|nr:precorrin-6A reductase [Agathobaculum sp.]MDY3619038.1 precorrin-6A reductase [Agathobaculum sp.]
MNVILFAGTSEGRALAEFLAEHGQKATVCVATEYGEAVLPTLPGVGVRRGRLSEAQMEELFSAGDLVIDATHPYAAEVTENVRAACARTDAQYIRLCRPRAAYGADVIEVPDAQAAAAYLDGTTGAALLTTGSKDLAAFTHVRRFAERLWPRVLPSGEAIGKCVSLGFPAAHIIAMQGPFSRGLNAALLRQTQAKFLVTKDSGAPGGLEEKLLAARDAGAAVVLIARPQEEAGMTLPQVKAWLVERLGLQEPPQNARFPLFVSLLGKKCVVFGAGQVAARRASVLRRFGAEVTVTAPASREIPADILRGYEKSDLSGVFLAVAATDDRAVNARIAADCTAAGILCSVCDSPEESTFFFPAVCEGGGLVAGVVSDGGRHAAVARAAERIRALLREEGDV